MRSNEPPSMMLILSAVDLLLASVVCGVVLLVSLVGAPSAKASGPLHGSAPVAIEFVAQATAGSSESINILGFRAVGAENYFSSSADAELYPIELSPMPQYWTRSYLSFEPALARISFSGLPQQALAILYLGGTGTYAIFFQCQVPGWEVVLDVASRRIARDTCTDRTGLPYPKTLNTSFVVMSAVVDAMFSDPGWARTGTLAEGGSVSIAPQTPGVTLSGAASSIVYVSQ